MNLRAVARDCLFLNWAVPVAPLRPPPPPLTYELQADDTVLVTALLFRQETPSGFMFTLSYPQLQVRLNVLDESGLPAALVRAILVPRWVLPGAKWWVRHAASGARFSLPASDTEGADASPAPDHEMHYSVAAFGRGLRVTTRLGGAPRKDWRAVFESIRSRPRAFIESRTGLRSIETCLSGVTPVPVTARCEEIALVPHCLELATGEWPELHSAWFCPEVSISYALGAEREAPLPRRVPAPG